MACEIMTDPLECHEITKMHPLMGLVRRDPMTWTGLFSFTKDKGTKANQLTETLIKVTLVAPNYPELTEARLSFDSNISLLYGTNLRGIVEKLLRQSSSVFCLLRDLYNEMVYIFHFDF